MTRPERRSSALLATLIFFVATTSLKAAVSITVQPNAAAQSATQIVRFTGSGTHFVSGTTTVSFGPGIAVSSVVVNGPTELEAGIAISATAPLGSHTVTATTGSEIASSSYSVQTPPRALTSLSTNEAAPGTTHLTVTLQGVSTSWANGQTTANFGPGISVGGAASGASGPVNVTSATTATATLAIDSTATAFARTVSVQTGAEVESAPNAFTVQSCPAFAANPNYDLNSIPMNGIIEIPYSAPLSRSSLSGQTFTLAPFATGSGPVVPVNVSLDVTGTVLSIAPLSVLPLNSSLSVHYTGAGITDACGFSVSVPLPGVSDTFALPGLQLAVTNPPAGFTNFPISGMPAFAFNEPVQLGSLVSGISIASASGPVAGSFSLATPTRAVFSPTAQLAANTTYTVTYTQALTNTAGAPLTNPGSFTFTTGPSATSFSSPTISPAVGASNVPTNARVALWSSIPFDPTTLTATSMVITDAVTGTSVPSVVSLSSDLLTLSAKPNKPLQPNHPYSASSPTLGTDFTTGSGLSAQTTVTQIFPANGATGVPLEGALDFEFSNQLDPGSLTSSAISVVPASGSPVQAGTITPHADGSGFAWTLSYPFLAANTSYTVTVSGLIDIDGASVKPFTITVTTGTAYGYPYGVPVITPAAGAVNVSRTAPIVITMNLPFPANALAGLSVTANSGPVAGIWSLSGNSATFTPSSSYPSGSVVQLQGRLQLTPNGFTYVSQSFTVAYASGAPSFTVTGITPANNLSGISPTSPILIRLSQPVAAIPQNAVQLFNGDRPVPIYSLSLSSDHKTIFIPGGGLSNNTAITLSLNSSLQDIYGTPMAPFTAHFTTAAANSPAAFFVVSTSPTGYERVPATAHIFVILNRAGIDQASVQNSLLVTANGEIVQATATFPDPELIEIIPAVPFPAGAGVSVSFTGQDIYGNALTVSPLTFSVAGPGPNPPQVLADSIGWLQPGSSVPVIEVEYDQPLDPSSIGPNDFLLQPNPGDPTPIPIKVTLTGASNNIVVIAPQVALPPRYDYSLTPGSQAIQGANGITATGFADGFVIPGPPVSTPARLIGTIPDNNWSGIGTNAQLTLAFDKPLNNLSVSAGTLTLSAGSQNVPIDWSISSIWYSGLTTLSLNPARLLSPNTLYTLHYSGFIDQNNNAVAAGSLTFTTGSGINATPPQIVAVSPTGETLPVNASITVQFDQPVATWAISQSTPQNGTWTLSADHKTATFTPTTPWAADTSVGIEPNVVDETGVSAAYFVSPSFETGYVANHTAPAVTGTNPKAGASGLPLNVQIEAAFSTALSATSLSGVTLATAAGPVSITTSLGPNANTLFVQPGTLLQPNTTYTLSIAGVMDTEGQPLATPYALTFTTGTTTLGRASILAQNPQGLIASLGPLTPITIQFSQPINPLSVPLANFLVKSSGPVAGTLSLSPDATSILFTPADPWLPGNTYTVYAGSPTWMTDIAGNALPIPSWSFVSPDVLATGSVAVASVSPANNSTVPANSEVQVLFTDEIDPATVNSSSITFTSATGAVPAGTLSVAGPLVTYALAPGAIWSPGSQYSVHVSGIANTAGAAAPAFTSSFTASAGIASSFQVVAVKPATNILPNNTTPITLTFNEPPDPLSVPTGLSVEVDGPPVGAVAGSWSIQGTSATFTPASSYPPNATVSISGNYDSPITDLAGNPLSGSASLFPAAFRTAPGVDTAPFRLVSITPTNGASGLGLTPTITLQFSQPVATSSFLNGLAIYSGGATVTQDNVTYSPDDKTVTLTTPSGVLLPGAMVTVASSPALQDITGNSVQPFESRFSLTTAISSGPTIQSVRPYYGATGVPTNIPITFFVSGAPVDASTIANAIHVYENGAVVPGTTRLVGTNVIQFIGSRGWNTGTVISMTVDPTLADVNGNSLWAEFQSSFTTVAAATPTAVPQLLNTSLSGSFPTNGRIELLFDQPLDPSSVTTSDFTFTDFSDSAVAFSVALSGSNQNVVVLTPQSFLAANTTYLLGSGSGLLRSAAGGVFSGLGALGPFYTGTQFANGIYLTQVNPPNTSYPVPTNANIQLSFNTTPDPLTLTTQNITILASGHAQPFSFALPVYGTRISLNLFTPLPANQTVTVEVSGLTDLAGNAIAPSSSQFVTGAGPVFNGPQLVLSTPDPSLPLPTNAKVFSWQFDEPVDPASILPGPVAIQYSSSSIPGTISQSADGKTITFIASQAMPAGKQVEAYLQPVTDLAGNGGSGGYALFTVGSSASTTPLVLTASNPGANWKNVPVNVTLQLVFSNSLDLSTVGGIQLYEGSTPVAVTPSYSGTNSAALTLQTSTLLDPNQNYTITLSGLRDVSGNTLANPTTIPFTTGPGASLTAPTATLLSPANPKSASSNTSFKVQFSAPVNPTDITTDLINGSGQTVPMGFSLSSDGTTATVTPTAALASGDYIFQVTGYDDAGNYLGFLNYSITVP